MKKGFTLIELLVVIAIIAILAAILFPVFAQAKDSAKQTSGLSNTKQTALGAIMYGADWEDVIPRHDNNGSSAAVYGEPGGQPPDWGNLSLSPNGLKDSEGVMFFGALQPYLKSIELAISPALGPTNWSGAYGSRADSGLTFNEAYSKSMDNFYYNALGQMAINILVVDYNSYLSNTNMRPGRVHGRLGQVARPSEIIMFAGTSSWDWGPSVGNNVGNGGVWPSDPTNASCWSSTAEGWTRYPHKGGSGQYAAGAGDRADKNPNLKGFATFAFCDGHAKALKFKQAERCEAVPGGGVWVRGRTTPINDPNYYPLWVPEI